MKSVHSKWHHLLREEDPAYSQKLYSIIVSVAISKSRGGDNTQTQAEIRGINGVTTLSVVEGSDREDQYNYYRQYLIKFELTQSQALEAYIGNTFIRELRKIKGLHKIKLLSKPRQIAENKNNFIENWHIFLKEELIRKAMHSLLKEDFQSKMKKQLPAELDFLLNKGAHNKKEGPGVTNPSKPKFKSSPPGAPFGETTKDRQTIAVLCFGEEEGLANRDVANVEGLQEYIENPRHTTALSETESVHIYKVEVCGNFGDYDAASQGAKNAHEAAKMSVGLREENGGTVQWYYFPEASEGHSWRIVEHIGTIKSFKADPVWELYGNGKIKINGQLLMELVECKPQKHAYTKDERPYEPDEHNELPSVWSTPWERDAPVIALKHYLENVYDIEKVGI